VALRAPPGFTQAWIARREAYGWTQKRVDHLAALGWTQQAIEHLATLFSAPEQRPFLANNLLLLRMMFRHPRAPAEPITDGQILAALMQFQESRRTDRRTASRAVGALLAVPQGRVEAIYPRLPEDSKGRRGRRKNPTR
jgi:hypothetical protein